MMGAPERVLSRCSAMRAGNATVPITPEREEELITLLNRMNWNGLTVLGFAEKQLELDGYPKGYPFDAGQEKRKLPNFP